MRERGISQRTKKRQTTNQLTAGSRLAFVSGKAQRVQKGDPSICEQKGPRAPVREKEGSAGKNKRKKEKDGPGGKGAACETPHSRLHKRGLLCTCEKRGTFRVKEIKK